MAGCNEFEERLDIALEVAHVLIIDGNRRRSFDIRSLLDRFRTFSQPSCLSDAELAARKLDAENRPRTGILFLHVSARPYKVYHTVVTPNARSYF